MLVLGFTLSMLLGVIYSWSVFVGPLEAAFGWSRAESSLIFPVSMASLCIGQVLSGIMIARTSPRAVLAVSAILAAAGFSASAGADGLGWLCFSYGVGCGLGVGLAANCVLATVLPWFPVRRGTVSGILLAGVGVGTFVLSPAVAALVAWDGWRMAFAVLAAASGILLVASAGCLRPPRPGEVLGARRDAPRDVPEADTVSADAAGTGKDAGSDGLSTGAMVKTCVFWLFITWVVLVNTGGMALVSNAVPAAMEVLSESPAAAESAGTYLAASTAMGFIGAFNSIGRLLSGWLWDKAGRWRAMATVSVVYGAAMLACVSAVLAGSFPLIVCGFMLLGAAYGGAVSASSAFTGALFGMSNYALNYAVVNANLVIASLAGAAIASLSHVAMATYLPAYGLLLAFAVASLGVVGLLARMK